MTQTALVRAKRLDRFMTWIITFGGYAIIAAVLGILVFIGHEALPLVRSARSHSLPTVPVSTVAGVIPDESGKVVSVLDPQAGVRCLTLPDGKVLATLEDGPRRPWKQVTDPGTRGSFAILDAEDHLFQGKLQWDKPSGEPDPTKWTPSVEWADTGKSTIPLQGILAFKALPPSGIANTSPLRFLARTKDGLVWGEWTGEGAIAWKPISLPETKELTTALWTGDGQRIWAGTAGGQVILIGVEGEPQLLGSLEFGEPVTALGAPLGEASVLVGGSRGSLMACQAIRQENDFHLQFFHSFESHGAAIRGFKPSLRDKRFLTWSDSRITVDHLTSEKRLFSTPGQQITSGALSPRGEYIYAATTSGDLRNWSLEIAHPEVTSKTLLGKVHYEGYEKPEYVWQSTGGTDDFEPKLSLMPLIFGTLKGTLFAMIFALPLAIFGALYTSQFAHPKIKNLIKPTVEIMAALPSVVLGFLAGLVLAPLLERAAIHVLLLPVFTILAACIIAPFWGRMPKTFRLGWVQGKEVLWLVPTIFIGLGLCLAFAPAFERIFLGGDFRAWLLAHHGVTYDQRNAIVVGFAMGFAIIPIIFSVSEDALSSVPKSLTSASLACGASPWQTAWRVVLPTASPGIFSAVMVGLGRAVGETMIVLMATGNTPLMDWSPFNGMRTLAANIAVEAPEAPVHGTLYRVLFLTALLLFALTFVLNTGAEVIRQHLRKRYETF